MAGPLWDFDWKTFRLDNEEWVTKNHLYFDVLFTDPVFVSRVKQRWNLYEEKLRSIDQFIESEAQRIRNSEEMNHQMWPITQNTNEDIHLSFSEAVARMKQSYQAKLEFMDRGIDAMK
jgi:NAD-dependent SIR2 family protein deacetylase